MESDSKTITKIKRNILNVSNVLPTIWIRFPFQADNGSKWIILDSRHYLLLNFRIILALVYIVIQTLK